jgi:hypothetical protein
VNSQRSSAFVSFSAFLVFQLWTVTPAFSWFDKGHRVVGLIAQAHLSDRARSEVEKILPASMTLADAAVWPDHEGRGIRDFDPLHYVSIPETAAGYDQARDCPERNCMVEALRWFSQVVADKNAPIMARRLALFYIAHLVGDMHQPLHAGRITDRGGTEMRVSYQGRSTNLHFFWDRDFVDLETGNEEEIARRLMTNLSDQQRLTWQSGDPAQWTNESLALVRSHAYNIGASGEITDDYVEKARPVVRTRMLQAGIRLAWLLNGALK